MIKYEDIDAIMHLNYLFTLTNSELIKEFNALKGVKK